MNVIIAFSCSKTNIRKLLIKLETRGSDGEAKADLRKRSPVNKMISVTLDISLALQ